jgi:hypothetical protein
MAKQQKKKKKAKKENATKIILPTDEERDNEEDFDEDEDESGIHLEKEDVLLIYNALTNYKPTGDEDLLYETLLEQFEEMLVVDFSVRLPGFEYMDEEEN